MGRKLIDTGIIWVGKIPQDWSVKRVKDFYRIVGGGTPSSTEIGIDRGVLWATPSDFSDAQRRLRKTARSISIKGHREIGNTLIDDNSVLISCRAPAGKVALPCTSISFNQGCKGLIPRGNSIHRSWFFYALTTQRLQIEEAAKGATFTEISGESLKRIFFPVPPHKEQIRIAAWLDIQVDRVEKRLTWNREKRELLIELRKNIIHKSTLRGLTLGVPTKKTNIAWLGSVPRHWDIVRLGSLFYEAADAGIEGLPMLSVSIHSGISDKELDEDEVERKVNRSIDKSLYKRVKKGDVVYNQMRAWQGAFGTAKIEGLVSPAYVVARPRSSVFPAYIEYLLRGPAGMEEMRMRSRGITDFRLRLYWDEFKNIRIALPPKDEQEEIAQFIDLKLGKIDKQIVLIDEMDRLLKEQRSAMIHAATNGTLDLSEYSPKKHK